MATITAITSTSKRTLRLEDVPIEVLHRLFEAVVKVGVSYGDGGFEVDEGSAAEEDLEEMVNVAARIWAFHSKPTP